MAPFQGARPLKALRLLFKKCNLQGCELVSVSVDICKALDLVSCGAIFDVWEEQVIPIILRYAILKELCAKRGGI